MGEDAEKVTVGTAEGSLLTAAMAVVESSVVAVLHRPDSHLNLGFILTDRTLQIECRATWSFKYVILLFGHLHPFAFFVIIMEYESSCLCIFSFFFFKYFRVHFSLTYSKSGAINSEGKEMTISTLANKVTFETLHDKILRHFEKKNEK